MAIVKSHIRNIKPEFFLHTELFDAEVASGLPSGTVRLAFIGLWTRADHQGRFIWNARELKVRLLPYDEVDFDKVLAVLEEYGFIGKYEHEGRSYGVIFNFLEHQRPSANEKRMALVTPPPPPELEPRIVTETMVKQRRKRRTRPAFIPPTIEAVQSFFMEEKGLDGEKASLEAEKFVNNYQAKGWVSSGRTRIVDWKAAAANWLLNSPRFEANPDMADSVARQVAGWEGDDPE